MLFLSCKERFKIFRVTIRKHVFEFLSHRLNIFIIFVFSSLVKTLDFLGTCSKETIALSHCQFFYVVTNF